jgi:hypothetical protein
MAANNDTFLRSLGEIYKQVDPNVSFNAKECRIQCFPHVINTCVKHTIQALNNGVDADTQADESDGNHDGDDDGGGGGGDKGGTNKDEGGEDLLNKVRGLIRNIRSSGQKMERFTNVIKGGNQFGWWKDENGNTISIEPKQLLRDVKTRWDSLYQMLIRLWEFRQVILLSPLAAYPSHSG